METFIADVVAGYRAGATADVFQYGDRDGNWGVLYTINPASPSAAERAGAQYRRANARCIRFAQKRRLRAAGKSVRTIVVATELPAGIQTVIDLDTGEQIEVGILRDATLIALENAAGLVEEQRR